MRSDNATNFTGVRAELLRLRSLLDKDVGPLVLAAKNDPRMQTMEWVFIPPGSPNFGGLWEAAVKSAKGHLKKVVGKAILSYEELATLSCDIDASSVSYTPLTLPTKRIVETSVRELSSKK